MDAKPPAVSEGAWTTRRLLQWMVGHFEQRSIESPRVCAEMLIASALGCERLELYMDPDRPASDEERARLRDGVRRVAANEPVQFVVGEAWFFSRPFHVDPATLIPRPSTERLVEEAIAFLRGDGEAAAAPARVLDLCTGTGCIAVTIALAKGVRAEVTATDLVPAALEVARRNAERHGARIDLRLGDLYHALEGDRPSNAFDLITANPPYVADDEWPDLAPNVREHEPATALRGGADGMDAIRRVIDGAPARLRSGGMLLVEIGHRHRAPVLAHLASRPELVGAEVLLDHEGIDRVLRAVRA